MVGVEVLIITALGKVSVRLSARLIGSPSAPALAGYLSISSHNKTLIGLAAKLLGLLAPAIVI